MGKARLIEGVASVRVQEAKDGRGRQHEQMQMEQVAGGGFLLKSKG